MNKKLLIIILSVVVVAGLGFALFAFFVDDAEEDGAGQQNETTSEQQKDTLRIVATGDMIAHDSVIANAETNGGYDFYSLMERMQPYFERADVSFCNEATPAGGEEFGIAGYPVFNAPLEWHDGMERVGCNVINLGTNHTNDMGQELIDAMVDDWDDRDVYATAGAYRSMEEREQIAYFEVEGVSFAFLSYSTYSNDMNLTPYGLAMYDEATATAEIAEAKEQVDVVMVSMRWGVEYDDFASDEQETIARTVAEAGADFVFGHGPHVLQPVERISTDDGREAVVWYSLGNFLNTQIPPETRVGGFAVMDISLEDLSIEQLGFLPVYSHYEWSADEAERNDLLARRNVEMFVLDNVSDEQLSSSQLDTTVEAERERAREVLNRHADIHMLRAEEYLDN